MLKKENYSLLSLLYRD